MLRSDPISKRTGVYLMKDRAGKIIYIGKAKNLKKRVSSYFQKQNLNPKVYALVRAVAAIDLIVSASEREALVLERSLIQKNQPVFNAMWKDDKSYPYVVLSLQEDFPRLYLARGKHVPAGAIAFGPYPAAGSVRGLIRELFRSSVLPLRPCRWDFDLKHPLKSSIINSCLYYHTKACPAPCAGLISRARYRRIAKKAQDLFSGKREKFCRDLEGEMARASRQLEFEKAGQIKKQIETFKHIQENILISEIAREDLAALYEPKKALEELQKALGLKQPPVHIEAFDISNLQGAHAVGSMVCFLEGKPNKNHYRRFKIKTITGIDDFAMMREVVSRRCERLLKENQPLPNALLIDGGIGQLHAAEKAIQNLGLQEKISLVALAKREEILYTPSPQPSPLGRGQSGGNTAIRLPKSHEGLKLAMAIRDEAHRFAIKYHKLLRKRELSPKWH